MGVYPFCFRIIYHVIEMIPKLSIVQPILLSYKIYQIMMVIIETEGDKHAKDTQQPHHIL